LACELGEILCILTRLATVLLIVRRCTGTGVMCAFLGFGHLQAPLRNPAYHYSRGAEYVEAMPVQMEANNVFRAVSPAFACEQLVGVGELYKMHSRPDSERMRTPRDN
jgi:hypothetical protein